MTQVTSLELSKKLAEAGLKIETEKWWCLKGELLAGYELRYYPNIDINYLLQYWKEVYPAPSTDELLGVMPEWYKIRKAHNRYYCMPEGLDPDEHPMITEDKNPAEALCKMILWLLSHEWRYNPETKMIEEA